MSYLSTMLNNKKQNKMSTVQLQTELEQLRNELNSYKQEVELLTRKLEKYQHDERILKSIVR